MQLKHNSITLQGQDGNIRLRRIKGGLPFVKAHSQQDAFYAQGWVHANDRRLHIFLTRIIMEGRTAEFLEASPGLVWLDAYIRRMQFLSDEEVAKQMQQFDKQVSLLLENYVRGVNDFISQNSHAFELKLLGIKPRPLDIADIMRFAKAFTYIGLASAQTEMQRFIIQLIQNGLDEKRLRALYPYLTDSFDAALIKKIKLPQPLVPDAVKWLSLIPNITSSNNWAVNGNRTKNKQAILCSDPHLEINRLPAVWHEMAMAWPGQEIIGVSLPGSPGIMVGRNRHIAWGPTYSFMDMLDFRIEHCKGGKYLRMNSSSASSAPKKNSEQWLDFKKTTETIRLKKPMKIDGKKVSQISVDVYENEHGVLEGDPNQDGFYLIGNWAARKDAGASDINGILKLQTAKTVKEAMGCFRELKAVTYNWVIADTQNNIGYQMSGRTFLRPPKQSGLMAHPAWLKRFDHKGFVDPKDFPSLYNPKENFIVTANNDLNSLSRKKNIRPINLSMADYRAKQITFLLTADDSPFASSSAKRKKSSKEFSANAEIQYMKNIHYNLYSQQAARYMKVIAPLLPNTPDGLALKKWDCVYHNDSRMPTLFENIYSEILKKLFGENGIGRDVLEYLLQETTMFNNYFGIFDDVFLNEKSPWFKNKNRKEIVLSAIEVGLQQKALPYGKTRRILVAHLLLGGRLPKWFGFDKGPFELPGSRATIQQGQIFKFAEREISFGPTFRFITDMQSGEIFLNGTAGISDRRFSKLYFNRHENWLNGVYDSWNIEDLRFENQRDELL